MLDGALLSRVAELVWLIKGLYYYVFPMEPMELKIEFQSRVVL